MMNGKRNPWPGTGKKSKREKFGGKPDFLLVRLVRIFLWFWFSRYSLKYDKTCLKAIRRPYVLIANHPSTLDAFLIGRVLNPNNTNFVASQSFFRVPILNFLLRRLGAIPKAHSQKDILSLRLMIKALSAGRVLMVCPEGRRSLDGTGSRFSEAMAKFVKKTEMPVVAAMISGTYLAWPRWADHDRPGPLSIVFRKIIDPSELADLTISEINQRMLEALRFNEFKFARESGNQYRSRHSAENIERLLHMCPRCGRWETIEGRGTGIRCRICHAAAVMEPDGSIRGIGGEAGQWPDVPAWYRLQQDAMEEAMKDPAFGIEAEVSCLNRATDPGKPLEPLGSGFVRLDREGLRYDGHADGVSFVRTFPIGMLDTLPVSLGHFFEICDEDGAYWQFRLQDQRKEVQFEQFSDICMHGDDGLR